MYISPVVTNLGPRVMWLQICQPYKLYTQKNHTKVFCPPKEEQGGQEVQLWKTWYLFELLCVLLFLKFLRGFWRVKVILEYTTFTTSNLRVLLNFIKCNNQKKNMLSKLYYGPTKLFWKITPPPLHIRDRCHISA